MNAYRVQVQADGILALTRIANPVQAEAVAHVRDLFSFVRGFLPDV